MTKRVIFYLFICLAVSLCIFYLSTIFKADIFFNIFIPAQRFSKEKVNLHLYNNEQISINEVLVRVYYYVPKDRQDFIINHWQKVFSDAMTAVSEFYQFQFASDMKMDFQIYPKIIYSNYDADYFTNLIVQDYSKELSETHSEPLTLKEIVTEVKGKTKDEKGWDLPVKTINNSYVVNMFILGLGADDLKARGVKMLGLNDESNNSLVISPIFTEFEFKDCFESVISHEIGHGLGIPEFYSYTTDEIKSNDIMGGGLTKKLQYNYLNYQIKEKMGLY